MTIDSDAATYKIKEISAPELKNKLERGQVTLVNVLSHLEFEIQHIPDSINIPVIEMKTTEKLPKNKDTVLVFYCMGARCPYARQAAKIAAEKGYRDIYVFLGGIPEWRRFNYPMDINHEWQKIRVQKFSPQKFLEIQRKEDPFILDVRPLNFQKDHESFIKECTFIPLVFLEKRYKEIPRNRHLFITDLAMKQSPVAAKFLITKGYTVIGVLKGGIERWKAEKLPIERRERLRNGRRTLH